MNLQALILQPVVEQQQQLVLFSLVAPLSLPVFPLGRRCVQRSLLLLLFKLCGVCVQQMLQVSLGPQVFCPLCRFKSDLNATMEHW